LEANLVTSYQASTTSTSDSDSTHKFNNTRLLANHMTASKDGEDQQCALPSLL
jgi:hypothetical protein